MNRTSAPAETLSGRVAYVFDDFFDVDLIIGPARMHDRNANEISYQRQWVMHDFDPAFAKRAQPGDMLVGGALFGYGHPHGQGMRIMRELGISVVLADSFFPSFHQNEMFNGMVLLTCPGIAAAARRWDTIEVEWRHGRVALPTRSLELRHEPLAAHEISCIEAGGELALLQRG
jgi:3-isopropylmalate/(R)-2-methylmalate dehydratase small subunit